MLPISKEDGRDNAKVRIASVTCSLPQHRREAPTQGHPAAKCRVIARG